MKPNEAAEKQEIMYRLKMQGSYMFCFPCVQENPMWSATRKHMMMRS